MPLLIDVLLIHWRCSALPLFRLVMGQPVELDTREDEFVVQLRRLNIGPEGIVRTRREYQWPLPDLNRAVSEHDDE
jgi:hypothetical protein